MRTVTALPTKGPRVKCAACGLITRQPIVVPLGTAPTTPDGLEFGRCANRMACDQRVRRTKNQQKTTTNPVVTPTAQEQSA